MQTITFYSYKGGTGRSLALANAARYLARLGFKVVAVDFDLEAPGLHYKFSNEAGHPLVPKTGVVDYLHAFLTGESLPEKLSDMVLDVKLPGESKATIQLIPAGNVPSTSYWTKLSRIDWHELLYKPDARGVLLFQDLKQRIQEELSPDFLLIDSRTGLTEMGGIATTVLAEKIVCLVLPSLENLEGSRAVLRSLKRTRRESALSQLEVVVAVSRLPEAEEIHFEENSISFIKSILNAEADDLQDTLSIRDIFVLHSESALQMHEVLRVGGQVSSDDSVLLRDYLRLFAHVVPRFEIEPKFGRLIESAKQRIWEDPEGALKEVEELAASFGHPALYVQLLQFYKIRNITGAIVLKKAQQLWAIIRDSNDPLIWSFLQANFDIDETPRYRRREAWEASYEFLEAMWRGAGGHDVQFAIRIAARHVRHDQETLAADILLETMKVHGHTAELVAECVTYLDVANRQLEADALIDLSIAQLGLEPPFAESWANHTMRLGERSGLERFASSESAKVVAETSPALLGRIYLMLGRNEEAFAITDSALRYALRRRGGHTDEIAELAETFESLGKWEDFEKQVREGPWPAESIDAILNDARRQRRFRRRNL